MVSYMVFWKTLKEFTVLPSGIENHCHCKYFIYRSDAEKFVDKLSANEDVTEVKLRELM